MKRAILAIAVALALVGNVASAVTTPAKIDALGPGTRIHGMDISYYQHPGNAAINFKKMYAAGIRFVIIKGGDTIDAYDASGPKPSWRVNFITSSAPRSPLSPTRIP